MASLAMLLERVPASCLPEVQALVVSPAAAQGRSLPEVLALAVSPALARGRSLSVAQAAQAEQEEKLEQRE